MEKKIAISSTNNTLEGDIDPWFGRCRYFLLVSIKNDKVDTVQSIENIHSNMRGGVGVSVAQMIAEHKVDGIIAENIGPRAMDIFRQFTIPVYHATGSKETAIENFINGSIEETKI